MEVLELFGKNPGPHSLSAMVQLSRKPKGSVHRILSTLVRLDLLKQGDDSQYSLTFKLWGIGSTAFAGLDLVNLAQPHIHGLARSINETAHLAVLDGLDCITYVSKVESQQSIKVQYWVGKRVPSWRTATGRSMLAFIPDAIPRLLAMEHEPPGGAALTRPHELVQELKKVQLNGYAFTKGGSDPDLSGISAPVRDHTGAVVAACGIAIPTYRMNRALVENCAPRVVQAANAISSDLGHLSPSMNAPRARIRRVI